MMHAAIKPIDVSPAGDDRRAGTDRVPIGRPSTVRADRSQPVDVVVEDLSSSGFRFRSDHRLAKGSMLHVGLAGGGMAQARVVRIDDTDYGCEFLRPLGDDQLRRAFSADTVVAGAFPEIAALSVIAYQETKLPGAARLLILATGVAVSWFTVFQIGTMLFR